MRTALEELLLRYTFDSMWNDDHNGETEAPTGYYGRIVIDDDFAVAITKDFAGDPYGEVAPADLVGAWFVWQTSTGAVYYVQRDLDQQAEIDALWEEAEKDYSEYLDADESEV